MSTPDRLDLIEVTSSFAELSAQQEQVAKWIEANPPTHDADVDVEIISTMIDVQHNRLVIGVRGRDQEIVVSLAESSEWSGLSFAVDVAFEAAEIPVFTSLNWGQTTPWLGGVRWNHPSDPTAGGNRPGCTVGWPLTRSGSSNGWLLTAGHCTNGGIGVQAWHSWTSMGTITHSRLSGNADFGVIRTPQASHVTAKIWHNYAAGQQARVGPSAATWQDFDTKCFTGRLSSGCAQTLSPTWSGAVGYPANQVGGAASTVNMVNLALIDVVSPAGQICREGDSGGPVYTHQADAQGVNWARPAGVLSAHFPDDPTLCLVSKVAGLPATGWNLSIKYW